MNIHNISLLGLRKVNEDSHVIITNLNGETKDKYNCNIFGVFDGHGIDNGKIISKFLSKIMPLHLTNSNVEYPLKKNYVKNLYTSTQNIIKDKLKKFAHSNGSTCLIVCQYKYNNALWLDILNTGDCRCIISKQDKQLRTSLLKVNCLSFSAIQLTKDHKPHWPDELTRITRLGGSVKFDGVDWRIGDLSVSRSFGDIELEKYVTYMPDLFRHKIDKDDRFMVLACDGLWDVMSNQDVVNFITNYSYDINTWKPIKPKDNIAKKLGEYAIKLGSTDNITIIIVFFQ